MSEASVTATLGWIRKGTRVYVNVDDLVAMLRAAGYTEVADDLDTIASEERRDAARPA